MSPNTIIHYNTTTEFERYVKTMMSLFSNAILTKHCFWPSPCTSMKKHILIICTPSEQYLTQTVHNRLPFQFHDLSYRIRKAVRSRSHRSTEEWTDSNPSSCIRSGSSSTPANFPELDCFPATRFRAATDCTPRCQGAAAANRSHCSRGRRLVPDRSIRPCRKRRSRTHVVCTQTGRRTRLRLRWKKSRLHPPRDLHLRTVWHGQPLAPNRNGRSPVWGGRGEGYRSTCRPDRRPLESRPAPS